MNLNEVKYGTCETCTRAMPLAHWVRHKLQSDNHNPKPDVYKAHENADCMPCMRSEAALIEDMALPTQSDDKRLKKLRRMMGI